MVSMQGATQIKAIADAVSNFVSNPKEYFEQASEMILQSIRNNFQQEGRPTRWVQLSAWTQAERKKQGYGASHPILERTGDLKRAASEKNAPGNEYQVNNNEATIKCTLEKAGRLHFGGGKLPARPFFFMQERDFMEATKIMAILVAKEVQKVIKI